MRFALENLLRIVAVYRHEVDKLSFRRLGDRRCGPAD